MFHFTKRDISILLGNSLDHFDTALYSLLAPHLAPIFFPNTDKTLQLILAYAVLASSIIARPAGAIIFGIIAKRHAHQGLYYSLIGLAVTTAAIGFLPNATGNSWLSPMLLVIIRLIQGVFAEGENVIAKLYILEDKSDTRAIYASYIYQSSTIFGIIVASFASWMVEISAFEHAWRICFWCGGATGLVGYYLRYHALSAQVHATITTSTSYLKDYLSLFSTICKHKLIIIQIAIIMSVSYATYSIPFIVMNSFVPLITDIDAGTMLALNTNLLIFDMLFIPLCGRYTQRYPPSFVMKGACMVLAITVMPLWYGLSNASLLYITVVRIWIVVCGIVFLCPLNFYCKQLVNSCDQYLVIGISNAVASATIGRLTPVICLYLWYTTHLSLSIACYMAIIVISAIYVINGIKNDRV